MGIRIDHPIPNEQVYGDGSFFCWGDHSAPFTQVTRAVATPQNGNPVSVNVTMAQFGTCTWYCLFTGLPTGTQIALQVYGIQNNIPGDVLGATVTFICRGHFSAGAAPAPPIGGA
jgi:hypothetical protein